MKVLIPAISQERVFNCVLSLRVKPDNIIVVDNSPNGLELPYPVGKRVHTGRNLGVARSWNIGVRAVLESEDDYLIICSQSVSFGRNGARDLKNSLTDRWGAEYVGMGWHLNAFSREFLETFGFFDENYYPAYSEDTDALYRMGLLGLPSPRENGRSRPYFEIDASCATNGGALKDGTATVDFGDIGMYYESKWGGPQGQERYKTPFNNPNAHVNWWPGVSYAGRP